MSFLKIRVQLIAESTSTFTLNVNTKWYYIRNYTIMNLSLFL